MCICTAIRGARLSHPLLTAPDRPQPVAAGRPDHRGDGGADLRRDRRDLHLRPAGHRGAGGLRAGFPVHDDDDHDGGRRHGRRRGGGHGARAGRRPDRGCPRAWCCTRWCWARASRLLFTLLAWTVAARALPAAGRRGRGAGQRPDLQPRAVQRLAGRSGPTSSCRRCCAAAATRRRPAATCCSPRSPQVPLSYVLALGIGDWPGLGMAGPAVSSLLTSTVVGAAAGARAVARQAGLHAGAGRHSPAGPPVLGHPAGSGSSPRSRPSPPTSRPCW